MFSRWSLGERRYGCVTEGPGTVIDKYKLLEKLGEGGFGVVYMAEQREPVKRRVALKIIKIGMDTREVVARFEAERQALAMMDHPNIAKVFDAGSTERPLTLSLSPAPSGGEGARRGGEGVAGYPRPSDGRGAGGEGELQSAASTESQIANRKSQIPGGRPYFVMELVRGIKITDYCDEKKLSTHERLDLFMKASTRAATSIRWGFYSTNCSLAKRRLTPRNCSRPALTKCAVRFARKNRSGLPRA